MGTTAAAPAAAPTTNEPYFDLHKLRPGFGLNIRLLNSELIGSSQGESGESVICEPGDTACQTASSVSVYSVQGTLTIQPDKNGIVSFTTSAEGGLGRPNYDGAGVSSGLVGVRSQATVNWMNGIRSARLRDLAVDYEGKGEDKKAIDVDTSLMLYMVQAEKSVDAEIAGLGDDLPAAKRDDYKKRRLDEMRLEYLNNEVDTQRLGSFTVGSPSLGAGFYYISGLSAEQDDALMVEFMGGLEFANVVLGDGTEISVRANGSYSLNLNPNRGNAVSGELAPNGWSGSGTLTITPGRWFNRGSTTTNTSSSPSTAVGGDDY